MPDVCQLLTSPKLAMILTSHRAHLTRTFLWRSFISATPRHGPLTTSGPWKRTDLADELQQCLCERSEGLPRYEKMLKVYACNMYIIRNRILMLEALYNSRTHPLSNFELLMKHSLLPFLRHMSSKEIHAANQPFIIDNRGPKNMRLLHQPRIFELELSGDGLK